MSDIETDRPRAAARVDPALGSGVAITIAEYNPTDDTYDGLELTLSGRALVRFLWQVVKASLASPTS